MILIYIYVYIYIIPYKSHTFAEQFDQNNASIASIHFVDPTPLYKTDHHTYFFGIYKRYTHIYIWFYKYIYVYIYTYFYDIYAKKTSKAA